MATSAELYQISWVIEKLLADPRRMVQARSQMHLGQQVQYFNWSDGKLRADQVVSMKDRRVTVLDTQTKRHVNAGIVLEPAAASDISSGSVTLNPPPEIGRQEDFRVSQRVSFTDADLQNRVGTGYPHQPADRYGGLRRLQLARVVRATASRGRRLTPTGRQERPRPDSYAS